MATVTGVAADLALEFGENYADPDISAQFIRWVKETYQEIAMTSRAFYKNVTEENTFEPEQGPTYVLTLDSDIIEIRSIVIYAVGIDDTETMRVPVMYYPIERINARGEMDTPGTPEWYYIVGISGLGKLMIRPFPAPDARYHIRIEGVGIPSTLTDEDTIPLPADYIVPLMHGVRSRVYLNQNDLQSAALCQQTYQGQLQSLNARFSGPQASASRLAVKRMRGLHQAPAAVDGS